MDNGFVLPTWAQKEIKRKDTLAKGLDRSEQMRQARGILTGTPAQTWPEQAAKADPRSWMQAPASDGQGWQGIFGLSVAPAAQAEAATPAPTAPFLGAPDAYGDPAERARESEMRRMMQQYASKEYWDTEEGKGMKALGMQDRYQGDDLAGFYTAQRAVGEGSIDEIIQGMGYTGTMADWARANKGMALREYLKKFPSGQPTTGSGDVAALTADQAGQTAGGRALMGARYALHDGAPVAPGITIGNEPGAVADINRSKTAQLQAVVPQAKSTGYGAGAFKMQPQSATATGYQLPAEAVGQYNVPQMQDDWNRLVDQKRAELQGLPVIRGYQGRALV